MKGYKMKGGKSKMPKESYEMDMKNTTCPDMKYTHGNNPETLTKSVDSLSSYVNKNKV